MYKISLTKELFEDILLQKTTVLSKKNSKYWQKELLEPKILEDKIEYSIKQVQKLELSNGLGEDKPMMIIECKEVVYNQKFDRFDFYLGKIIEQKNTAFSKDYKDVLIEQLLKEKEVLEENINRDYLTKVYNRRKMDMDLKEAINHKNIFLLTSIFINIDDFANINEKFGEEIGDKVLEYLASKLQKHSKLLDGEVYRYLDDFVILCYIKKDRLISKLNDLKEDIKSQINYYKKEDISISVSMGVAFFSDYNSTKELIKFSKEALLKAKKEGKDRIEII